MNLLDSEGIEWKSTVPYSSEQNGIVEKGHHTLMDSARSMLHHARLPKSFWGPAILAASHIYNKCPHPNFSNTTPHEVLNGTKPDIHYMRVFGCDAYALVEPHKRTKLDPRAKKGIFLGYAEHQKGYQIYNPETGIMSVHRSVVFNENAFGCRTSSDALADADEPEFDRDDDYTDVQHVQDTAEICTSPHNLNQRSDITTFDLKTPTARSRNAVVRYGDLVSHHWINTIIPKAESIEDPTEPKTFDEAKSSPLSEYWMRAVENELDSLLEHETWIEVQQLPTNKKAIGCRWVFKIKKVQTANISPDANWIMKHYDNGISLRFKARLVVQGFRQRHGIDYSQTYAPVMRTGIMKLMIALSVQDSTLICEQMDVVTAFLNAKLSEELYMKTPEGSKARTRFVKLLRSLYGLKQAPFEWFKMIDQFLVHEQGFTRLASTTCLYIKHDPSGRYCIVGVYVDDLPIIGHPELVLKLKDALSCRFKMSDLGCLKSCIGIGINRNYQDGSVFLEQEKYLMEILKTYGMDQSKPQKTPASEIKLSRQMCPQNEDDAKAVKEMQKRTDYRAAVGHLIWLLHTRPDISYAVGEVAKYVQNPGVAHFVALKRIFRYLRGTSRFGLLFKPSSSNDIELVGFSDSDWAGTLTLDAQHQDISFS